MRRVLLVEPSYRNKYPPLGLMKIASYHKLRGDEVSFVKGTKREVRQQTWDRIYVSTLFTFLYDITIETIKYYQGAVRKPRDVYVGGVLATLMGDRVERETGARVVPGLLDKPGILDAGDKKLIDGLIPDYSILQQIDYKYALQDAYLGYATRGCPNRCRFCAVHRLEPKFQHYLPLKRQIKGIEAVYGTKQDLILLDNNVLASVKFADIIAEIVDLGFERGAKVRNRKRRLDFNQGVDAHLLDDTKMKLIARTAIHPLRIAFDSISMRKRYEDAVKLAATYEILDLSNYVLFNYMDTPEDFYERLRINLVLNHELGTKIYSFPMKYVPLTATDRSHVGRHWNRQLLRGVQCILLATYGKIGPRLDFFEAAFGRDPNEFRRIALMPEQYIIYRRRHENNGASEWGKLYDKLTSLQREEFTALVARKHVDEQDVVHAGTARMKRLLSHYVEMDRSR